MFASRGCPIGRPTAADSSGHRNQYQSDDYADLLTRWFQYSTFCPVQRIHGYQSETEFWKFPKAQDNLIAYDRLRYRLLPYIYSIAWRVTHDGYTMMRALPMDFPDDASAADIGDQYMFGPCIPGKPCHPAQSDDPIAVSPEHPDPGSISGPGSSSPAESSWKCLRRRSRFPLFIRAGSILPMGPDLQYAGEKPADPIELRVYRGADGSFTLYEDEGDSYRYEKGAYTTIPIRWTEASRTLTIADRSGEFPAMLKQRTFRIVWVRQGKGVGALPENAVDAEVQYDGKSIVVRMPEGI